MKQFFADHYFRIGQAHIANGTPCQDFALSGRAGPGAWAVLSDGCSSGGHTDMGARILSFATAAAIRAALEEGTFPAGRGGADRVGQAQKAAISEAQRVHSLDPQDMLATCLWACATPLGGMVHVRGDGVAAWLLRDGRVAMSRYDWPDNRPFYPAYEAQDGGAAFAAAQGGDMAAPVFREERWIHVPSLGFLEAGTSEHSLAEGMAGAVSLFGAAHVADEISFIALFSDGVEQIDGLGWKEAVLELLAFKTEKGAFVKRRAMRAIRDGASKGRRPVDDIACAVIGVAAED